MKTTNLPLEKLIAYAGNPRRNDHAVEAVAAAIKRFGFRVPVLAKSDGSLIDGHLRVKAAKHLGMEEVPVVLCDDLSEADIKALRISINRMAELAEWDTELLSAELEGLAAEGFSIEDLGFDAAALEELGADLGLEEKPELDAEPQIDKAEELRAKWGVEPGQLWGLGEHRLLCGDSTKKEDVERVMGGEKADCGFSDPPYGIAYKSGTWSDKRKNTLKELENDNLQGASLHDFLQGFYKQQKAVTTGDLYICCEWKSYPAFHAALTPLDKLTNVIVWDKRFQTQALNTFAFTHEFILFFGNNGGPYRDTNVWQCDREFSDFHATPKPVKLVAKAIDHSNGKIVTDFFSGSGTTIIACEQLGRKCRAIEISPAYVAVALQRWADATGKTPKLVA